MLKRLMIGVSLAATLLLLAPVSQADASWSGWWARWRSQRRHHVQRRHHQPRGHHRRTAHAPELDPGASGSALVLLIGGVAYIASRRREEDVA
jgi:hypothetical protein